MAFNASNCSNCSNTLRSVAGNSLTGFYIMSAFTTVIISVGLLANAITIVVIYRTRSLHTTTNFLLANLALSDFLTLVFGIPNGLALIINRHPTGLVGKYLCIFLTSGNVVGMTTIVSIFTLCLLAVERYHAIVKPMALHRRLTTHTVKYALYCVWTLSLIITMPTFIYTTFNPRIKFCDKDWDQELIYILISIFIAFVIPLVVITTCYAAIIKELYWVNKVEPSPIAQQDDARSKRRLVKMLLIVTSLFLVCFGAFSCLWPMFEANLVNALSYNTSVQCLFLQSCFNPIIYIFQSTNYREALVTMLRCRRRTGTSNQTSTRVIELESTRRDPVV